MSDILYWTAVFGDSSPAFNWRAPIQLPNSVSSAARSALASYKNKLWCVHRGGGSNMELWWQYFDFNNNGWTSAAGYEGKIPHGQQSPYGPALAAFNNELYCIYAGTDANIYCTTTSDGSSWSNPTYNSIGNNFTRSSPALAVANNQLWCVYHGLDNNLYCIGTSDGQKWSEPRKMGDNTTTMGPALATFAGKLWCVYRGRDNNDLYSTTSSDGRTWSTPAWDAPNWQQYSDGEPALVYDSEADELMCMFRGGGSDTQLWSAYTSHPDGWSPPQPTPGCYSTTGPALAEINGIIFCIARRSG